MKALYAGSRTRIARCREASLPLDRQEPLGWCHLELLEQRRSCRREAGAPMSGPVVDRADTQPRGLHAAEAGLTGTITSDKFCGPRWGPLPLSWWRRPRRVRRSRRQHGILLRRVCTVCRRNPCRHLGRSVGPSSHGMTARDGGTMSSRSCCGGPWRMMHPSVLHPNTRRRSPLAIAFCLCVDDPSTTGATHGATTRPPPHLCGCASCVASGGGTHRPG